VSVAGRLRQLRDWVPTPIYGGRPRLLRWFLLGGNRVAVVGALLTGIYAAVMVAGTVWTFEIQNLLTETRTVENLLDTFLSGMILLVSVVVSINSIVLSHDLTSVGTQTQRIDKALDFRKRIGSMTETGSNPSTPRRFLELFSGVILTRVERLVGAVEGESDDAAAAVREHAARVERTASQLDDVEQVSGAEFGVLLMGLSLDYGDRLDQSQQITTAHGDQLSEEASAALDDLDEALEAFAVGKEYFKTLYYRHEVSELSQTLLLVSLPVIILTTVSTLAIGSGVLPNVWLFGLPPVLSFVAVVFTVALVPFAVLISYSIRLATVAQRTSTSGPFSLTS